MISLLVKNNIHAKRVTIVIYQLILFDKIKDSSFTTWRDRFTGINDRPINLLH